MKNKGHIFTTISIFILFGSLLVIGNQLAPKELSNQPTFNVVEEEMQTKKKKKKRKV